MKRLIDVATVVRSRLQQVHEKFEQAVQVQKWISILCGFLLVVSGFYILGLFIYTFWHRVDYPYDLEWMEGGMLIHGHRVMNGQALYVLPSSDFIPYIYPPLYSWLLGIGGWLFGLDYDVGRTLSFLGSGAAGVALFQAIRLEKGSLPVAVVSSAFFFSCYDETGSFMDLVRTDGLVMGLLAWALVAVRQKYITTGGLLLCLAFMAKHNTAIFGVPCLWWLWRYVGRREALLFTLWSALPALLFTAFMHWKTDGLFLVYLLEVPSEHPFVARRFFWLSNAEMLGGLKWLSYLIIGGVVWFCWRKSVLHHQLWVTLLVVSGMYLLWTDMGLESRKWLITVTAQVDFFSELHLELTKDSSEKGQLFGLGIVLWSLSIVFLLSVWRLPFDKNTRFWMLNGVLALLLCSIMRGHHGGYKNVLMPGMWMIALWGGLLLNRACQSWGGSGTILATVLAITQLYSGQWEPGEFIPTEEDRKAGDALIEKLKEIDGPVFAPHAPWYPVLAGHPPSAHLIALWDINWPRTNVARLQVDGIPEDGDRLTIDDGNDLVLRFEFDNNALVDEGNVAIAIDEASHQAVIKNMLLQVSRQVRTKDFAITAKRTGKNGLLLTHHPGGAESLPKVATSCEHIQVVKRFSERNGPLNEYAHVFVDDIKNRRWAAILLPRGKWASGLHGNHLWNTRQHYSKPTRLLKANRRKKAFYPKVGWPVRPDFLYLVSE